MVIIMNKVILMGRLARDPVISYSQGENSLAVARYTLAVNRRFQKGNNDQTADFISCVAFGKAAEFAEKWFRQGLKICISGRIQTGSYTNKDGNRVYTTDVIIEEQDFAESKNNASGNNDAGRPDPGAAVGDVFMNIPAGIEDELPFQ